MTAPRRVATVSAALALAVLAIPASALGQATRTWVSGVGDDANPCSRTAPCKTFAGAISKTAARGEINVIDPGAFGALTITKSITVKGVGNTAGVLPAGGNGIVINAALTDKVVLQGLDLHGALATGALSQNGVRVLRAKSVIIRSSEISGFQSGVSVVPSEGTARVDILRTDIHNNGVGVFSGASANTATSGALVSIRNSDVQDNTCGLVSSSFGPNNATAPQAATNCGSAAAGGAVNRTTTMGVFRTGLNDNTTAVSARGSLGTIEIGSNDISNNSTGLQISDGGTIRSFANNHISSNGSSANPNSPATVSLKVRGRSR